MTPDRASDSEITEWALDARHGDRDARDRFVRATQRDVWRFVAHLAGPARADDLAQDTFLRALRSLPTFSGRSTARVWLLSIARRAVIDHIRAARVRPRRAEVPDWQASAERAQPRDLPGFDDRLAINELLDGLAGDRREAFVLTQQLGLSYAEAAAICRCPIGTIRSRVARARDELITLLRQAEDAAGRSAG
ncbi:sigma-70 family RNA polymerase sigma factor [Gandjariella thermophila]|uniref:RNA polymerase sigma factor n=1 Tax=Gandjariella thermophila TaxID=1931992 RepID=A0A4D4JCN6_9PSEU|nr:sigma-70 family RNA polymerase sigma factor [Gandjariella thermophila]GDY33384.1 RNA polymerase sigma factor [Gandjariella thermophila]